MVSDAQALVRAGIVDADQLAGERSRADAILDEISAATGKAFGLNSRVWSGDHHLSIVQFVVDQYQKIKVSDIPLSVLVRMAAVDGALVVSECGDLLGFGVILHGQNASEAARAEGA